MSRISAARAEQLIALRRALHRVPELGFAEVKTQALLLDVIHKHATDRVEVRTWKTGILVRVRGRVGARTLAYRADIDGLPITEQTGLPYASEHVGMMHACGHDMHMAIAIGVLLDVIEEPLDDHVLVVFQPAEEGPGGALPMMDSAPFLSWWPDAICALHIAPKLPVGTVSTRPGVFFADTSELTIDVYGVGGHAAFPHDTVDAIVVAAALVGHIQTIVARSVNPLDAAVISLGTIQGGTRQNIIADHVQVTGTIRTLRQETLTVIKQKIEAIVDGVTKAHGARGQIDYGLNYVHVVNDRACTQQFEQWVRQDGRYAYVESDIAMTGEDFGYFVQRIPGMMFWLGVDTPYGLHHAQIAPCEDAIAVGVDVVASFFRQWSARLV
jgi:N-acetyldiaminopimelate deacetylase